MPIFRAITRTELLSAGIATLLAVLILSAYVADSAGIAFQPGLLALVLAAESLWLLHGLRARWRAAPADPSGVLGYALVVLGVIAYWTWLSAPQWLPLAFSYDLSHHLALIEYIQRYQHLPHDPALQPYLDVDYTPGGHLLAALLASWSSTVGLYVVQPLIAALAALKAGMLYHISLRLHGDRPRPPIALATALLLLVVHGYFIQSFTVYGFLPQLFSEFFAIAMLWLTVAWFQAPRHSFAWQFGMCGVGMFLAWPVWLPVLCVTLAAVILLRRALAPRARLLHLALSLLPVGAVGAQYFLSHYRGASIITFEGGTIKPWLEVFGAPLIILSVVGVIAGARRYALQPLHIFAAAGVAMTCVFLFFDLVIGERSFYQTFKTFYLLIYVLLLYAGFALADIWRALEEAAAAQTRLPVRRLAWLLPLAVLALAAANPVPVLPRKPFDTMYRAGVWTREHLPAACVDYLVDRSEEYYWLHTTVLGNSRETPRLNAMLRDANLAQSSAAYWSDPARLPYAIVPDARTIPASAVAGLLVLFEDPPTLVVQVLGRPSCTASGESWYGSR